MTDIPEVLFDEDAHSYAQDGVTVPRSVTGLLKKYGLTTDFSGIPRHILENARQRGKAIAIGCKLLASGYELGPVDERIAGYLQGFTRFWQESGAILIESEIPRISPLGFGFTVDLWVWLGSTRYVIDGKATHKLPKSVGPQTGGYLYGLNSLFPDKPTEGRGALWLKKDGTYKFKELDDPDDLTAFSDCLVADIKLTNWRIKYGE